MTLLGDKDQERRVRAAVTRGDRARDGRRIAEAAQHYRRAVLIEPGLEAIWVQYGNMLKDAGQLIDAEHAYQRAIALGGSDGDAFLQLGHALKLQGRIDAALDAYRQAARLSPERPEVQAELQSFGLQAGQ